MKSSKIKSVIIFAVLFAGLFLSGCVPREERNKSPFFRSGNELIQTINEKLKNGTLKDSLPPEIVNAMSERIKSGKIQDLFPPASVMVPAMLIPIVCVLSLLAFIILFVVLYHKRKMAMIEKGNYEPWKVRWDLIILFFGIVLSFVGPGVSIYMISFFGFFGWTLLSGIIPLFIGVALLVYYRMYKSIAK